MDNDKCLFALDALWDIHALAIHNIKLSNERQWNQFPTYEVPEFVVGDKVLVGITQAMYGMPYMMLLTML